MSHIVSIVGRYGSIARAMAPDVRRWEIWRRPVLFIHNNAGAGARDMGCYKMVKRKKSVEDVVITKARSRVQ
jgi:hypothetical protein